MKADLIITNIGQLATCASDGKPKRGAEMRDVGLIENGAIAVVDQKFAAVGLSSEVRRNFQSENEIDAGGKVVCPGFVDPHTHIVFAGDRLDEFELKIKGANYLEILARGGGILSTVERTRSASADELVTLGLTRLDQMLACGTTTAEIKTGYGLDTDNELKMLKVIDELYKRHPITIVPTFLPAHAIPSEFSFEPQGYVDLVCNEMLARAWQWYVNSHFHGSVPFFLDVFCEENAFDLEQTAQILKAGMKIGFRLKAHVDEFTNLGACRRAIALGATSVDHLDETGHDEMKLLAASDTIGVLTPAVNFNFGSSRFADARRLIDSGCAIALSTDYNPGSAPCPSLPMAMAIACRYQKLLPAEALNAATVNAALAVGVGDRCGSIEAGKSADLLIAEVSDHRELAYEFGSNPVGIVVKNGKVVSDKSEKEQLPVFSFE
ncbi:MAG TPA: imidazolonepropionase [Pyrinomonadaceae bacterium]